MSKLQVTAQGDREILVTRSFAASPRAVFDAHTQPELVKRWLGPGAWKLTTCEIDARPGGRFRYVMSGPDGKSMGLGGTFEEVTPPTRIVHNELFDEDWTGGRTTVTTELAEADGGTALTMTVRYASTEARDGALQSGMAEGMAAGYDEMDRLLAAG